MTDVLPASRAANLALLAGTWMVLLGWQVVTVRSRRLPSFGDVVALVRRWRATRWALLLWWGWLGWHLFVRTSV